ncbi:methyltransferase family protein [Caldisalinibacter kiritimatiensis]|uniref:Isoprenylcysteine carboxylmethyltransferase family protein n=1 Tax=Caldisalinibacter kiritimatiensis TaxID=1304284 RepID=R1AW08_9FIRM|nr:isoprenylcysteine carboxylmethyltransferase family protein [Caldisalinibacter kiritimatiensis]EOD00827.1 hypothetical protein L21TH_1103 [Caldisalinibacter kiritimatiensis]
MGESQKHKKIIVFSSLIFFSLFYWGIKHLQNFLPDLTLWRTVNLYVDIVPYRINIFDIIHYSFGLMFFITAILNLLEIYEQSYSENNNQSNEIPKLMTTGHYGRVRHPMYGTLMLMWLGLFFSLRSLYGASVFMLIVIVQVINGIVEEKTLLARVYGKEYEEYKKRVKTRFLTEIMKLYFSIASIIIVFGIVFMV